jgi:hypothetical protein
LLLFLGYRCFQSWQSSSRRPKLLQLLRLRIYPLLQLHNGCDSGCGAARMTPYLRLIPNPQV